MRMSGSKESINPVGLFNSRQYGFSQVVTSMPGKLIFISGQVAWDADENIVGPEDLEIQTRKAIDNLKLALVAAGGDLNDIVMLRIYKVNYKSGDGQIISRVLNEVFDANSLPASTWINVRGLASEDFMIEIEAQAVLY